MTILVVGECLVDLAPVATIARPSGAPPPGGEAGGPGGDPYSDGRHFVALPGGGPANVAVGLARLGVPTAFAGRFSHHGFGPWLRDHLVSNGVDLSPSVNAPQPASLAVVTLDPSGQASYTFYGPETADWQWVDDELPTRPSVAAVHTGSLATTFEPGASVVARWVASLRGAGEVLVSFDPNVRPGLLADVDAYRGRIDALAGNAHIVKASSEDVAAVYPGDPPLVVAQRWLEAGTTLVLITDGERGAMAVHRNGGQARCVPPPVVVADTIGAGDSFTSGLLAYLAEQELLGPKGVAGLGLGQLEAALARAVAVSALTCTRPGADPPDRAQLAAFLAQ